MGAQAYVMTYQIHTLPQPAIDAARDGSTPAERVVATGGEPVRCCLRNATAGDAMLLFNYEPPLPASPYRETGAIFVHADPCPGATAEGYPPDWYGRPQVLRAYDSRGWIHPATRVHDGTDPEPVITGMLADPTVVQIHSRNVAYGCYMFTITR